MGCMGGIPFHPNADVNELIPNTYLRRGYPLKKIQENNEAEIMGVVCDEARESYQHAIIVELESNTMEDLEENVTRIVAWIEQWIQDNAHRGEDEENE